MSDNLMIIANDSFIVFLIAVFAFGIRNSLKRRKPIPGRSPKPKLIVLPLVSIYFLYQLYKSFQAGLFEITFFRTNQGVCPAHNILYMILFLVISMSCWVFTWTSWHEIKQRKEWMFLDKGGWF